MPATRSNTTVLPAAFDVTFVVDRSGSMHCVGNAMREGVSELLQKHAKTATQNPSTKYHIRLVSFDDRATVLYDGDAKALLAEDGELNTDHLSKIYAGLVPRGRTRLIDTLIDEIKAQRERTVKWLSELPNAVRMLEPHQSLVFAALTDGMNNVGGDIHELIELMDVHQATQKASCQFIAANQDAIVTGTRFGFPASLCLQMDADPEHARAAMTCITDSALRTFTGELPDFSQVERTTSSQGVICAPEVNPFFCQPMRA